MISKKLLSMIVSAALILSFSACGQKTDDSGSKASPFDRSKNDVASGEAAPAYKAAPNSFIDTSDLFSKRDLLQQPDTEGAEDLTAEDGKEVTVSKEGNYILRGEAKNFTLKIDAPDDAKIGIILDGVSIENSGFACIYAVSCDKVFITSIGENSLGVSGAFTPDGDINVDSVIFAKTDLTLNGTGSLKITCAKGNGITSKDDLKITGGSYEVATQNHGFEANDSIRISGGSFTVSSKKDGFHCKNSKDDTKGYVYISGGVFDISASSDGIQGTTFLEIDGGELSITSAEGLEATYVIINDGKISINASDDGINASRKSTAYDVVIEVNGGEISVVMGPGDTDAFDSNGRIYINGGLINVTGQSAFDWDISGEYSGGTVYVNGEQIYDLPSSQFGRGGFGGGGFGGGGFGGGMHGGEMPGGRPEGGMQGGDPPDGFGRGDKFGKGGRENGGFGGDRGEGPDAVSGATEKTRET